MFAAARAGKFGEKFSDPKLFELPAYTQSAGSVALHAALQRRADDAEIVTLVHEHPEAAAVLRDAIELLCVMQRGRMDGNFVEHAGHVITAALDASHD